ncbi:dipeptidase [Cyclobacterium qasimii]|uniref:Zn-dependent dipeptidase n=2 Tax=Cyclobacterium qasimii TaxID=1350429 RepID=S7X030_9BACT|nr:dipeptidase [Cyclobacterium qasimii]EPR69528.1 Zn-dependent dipeptidase [Cyclobacterium qasimii M12-11B]GEO21381.1 dipeptidase [Cyclobacterium qasimii]
MKSLKALICYLITATCLSCSPSATNSEDYQNLSEEERFELAKQIAHNTIIVDGHVDLPYRMRVERATQQQEILNVADRTEGGDFDYPRSKEGGLDAPFMSIYIPARHQETGGAKMLADSLIQMTKSIAITWPEKFAMAYSPKDIQHNFEKGMISLPLGMENGAPIEGDIENLKYFYDQGIRYITLTHGKDNQIGDSSYDTTYIHDGLSEFGVLVVKEMNRLGIMVDISHVSDATFYDVMETSKVPVIASHSSARHFTPGFERNMDDEMIKKLGENGGVIMINFGGSFIDQSFDEKNNKVNEHIVNWLAENGFERNDPEAEAYIEKYVKENNPFPSVEKVADHIDHVRSLAGIGHIGLGSDFDGVGDTLPIGLKDVSMYPNLIAELLKRGYSIEDIEKICYQNIFRVWNKVIEFSEAN